MRHSAVYYPQCVWDQPFLAFQLVLRNYGVKNNVVPADIPDKSFELVFVLGIGFEVEVARLDVVEEFLAGSISASVKQHFLRHDI